MEPLVLGLAANAAGAHTQELFDGFTEAREWTGVSCTHFWAEDGRDPEIAERAATSLAAREVPLVIGHLSAAACLTAARIYQSHDIALVAPATSHPKLNVANWPGIVRVCGSDIATAEAMLNAADPTAPCAIICQDQIFGRSLAQCLRQALEGRGRSAKMDLMHTEGDALPFIPADVTEVFVTGIHEYCASTVRSLRAVRSALNIILGDDCLTANFPKLAGSAADHVTVVGPTVPGLVDVSAGYKPAVSISTAIALQAMASAPGARGAELGVLMRSRKWSTPYGMFEFDNQGDIVGLETCAYRVQAGTFFPRPAGAKQKLPSQRIPTQRACLEAGQI